MDQPLGHAAQNLPHLSDIQGSIEVSVQSFQIPVGSPIAPGDLAHQKEVLLAQIGGKLLDAAAKAPSLLEGYML